MNILSRRLIINTNRILIQSNASKRLLYPQSNLFYAKYPFSVCKRYFSKKCLTGCIY